MNKNRSIQEYWATLVAAGLAPDWNYVYYKFGSANDPNILLHDGEHQRIILSKYGIEMPMYHDDDNCLRDKGIDLVKLEWLPYEQDDGVDQEYWILQDGMVGVSEVGWVKNGIPATKWGSGNPVLKKTHGDIAPKPEDFEEE